MLIELIAKKKKKYLLGLEESAGSFFFWEKKAVLVKFLEFGKPWRVGVDFRVGKECERLKPNSL